LKSWNERFEQVKSQTNKVVESVKGKEVIFHSIQKIIFSKAEYNSRLLNCMNIVNESEIEVCQKEEKLAFIENLKQVLIDCPRK